MTPLPKSVSTELRFPKVFMLMTYGAERITLSERSNLVLRSTIREILTRQSIEMGPEGYIEIDMDGDDELIDAMTYDEWITQPETTC